MRDVCFPYPDKTIFKDSSVDLKTPSFPNGSINSQELRGRGGVGDDCFPYPDKTIFKDSSDQFRFLGNCPPTPPLS